MSRRGCCSCCDEQPYYRESQNNNLREAQLLSGNNSWCWDRPCSPNPWRKRKNNEETEVEVITNINICQQAEANGGDTNGGDGGDGGNATGGNANAASAEVEGDGDATAVIVTSVDEENGVNHKTGQVSTQKVSSENLRELLPDQLKLLSPEQLEALQSLLDLNGALGIAIGDAAAVGGSATGGNGGNGGTSGTGGAGGTAQNTATVNVEQVVVIVPENNGPYPTVTLGTNSNNIKRNVEITMDEKGNTFVNGQKMDEQELANGTKVMIFRNSETKETKK